MSRALIVVAHLDPGSLTWLRSMPALLKGWIDRVFINGWAFGQTEGGSIIPKLHRLSFDLIPITGSDASAYERHGYHASIRTQNEHGILDLCGAGRATTT